MLKAMMEAAGSWWRQLGHGGGNWAMLKAAGRSAFYLLLAISAIPFMTSDFQCSLWNGLVTLLMIPLTTSITLYHKC